VFVHGALLIVLPPLFMLQGSGRVNISLLYLCVCVREGMTALSRDDNIQYSHMAILNLSRGLVLLGLSGALFSMIFSVNMILSASTF